MRVEPLRHFKFYSPSFRHRALLFVCTLLLCCIGFQSTHAFVGNKDITPVLEKLEADIQDSVRRKQIPGCAVAVVYKNQIVYMKGFGVRTIGTYDKVDVDTVFQLGSVSKPIAATLATILESKGLLKLEDPVIRYLPNFALNSNQSPYSFKVKHILSHCSGISRGGFNNLIESFAPYEDILNTLKKSRVQAPFGKRYDYHNAMFSVISEITHAACGLSFSNALRTNLLQPLNMNRTSATLYGLMSTPNRASPHTRNRRYGLVPNGSYSKGYYTVAPAGGINSSIRDMANFLKAQLGGFPNVLNSHTLAKLQSPVVSTKLMLHACDGPPCLIKNSRYALGWRVVDFDHHKLIYHGGMLRGFTNFIALMPQHQVGIVILHNSNSRFTSQTGVKFFEAFLDVPKHHYVRSAKSKRGKIAKNKKTLKCQKNQKKQKTAKGKKAQILLNLPNSQKAQNTLCLPKTRRAQSGSLKSPTKPAQKAPKTAKMPSLERRTKTLKVQTGPKLPKPVKELLRNSNQKVVKREVKPLRPKPKK